MRLIDADACPALFDVEFKATKHLIFDGEKHLDNLAEGFMEAHNVIRSMPTIDADPVVHGRWLPPVVGKYGCLCSVCKKQSDNGYDYCPNCGAKMDLSDGKA